MLRRLAVFVVTAAATAAGLTYWLHDGDLHAAAKDGAAVISQWDADGLARDAGIE